MKFTIWLIILFTLISCKSYQAKDDLKDAGVIGPDGEVLLFYREGANIVIKECEDHTILNKREDCQLKSGGKEVRVPVERFRSHIKVVLKLSDAEFNPKLKQEVDLYNKGRQEDIRSLVDKKAALEKDLKKIEDFSGVYGGDNAKRAKAAELKAELAKVGQLPADVNLRNAITTINRLIDELVDQTISNRKITIFVHSKDRQGFAFNVLRSYLKVPDLGEFVEIKAGRFTMGSSPTGREKDVRNRSETSHSVIISKNYWIQATEVTQQQWLEVMGDKPSRFSEKEHCPESFDEADQICPNNPVEMVFIKMVNEFIKKLNGGKKGCSPYCLPTEAQWEYAARAGASTAYSFGDDPNLLGRYAWYASNSRSVTHAVKTRKANPWGLYDMHGNVGEWVEDTYADFPSYEVRDPKVTTGSFRVIRGGSWDYNAQSCRSAYRNDDGPGYRYDDVGFRLVRVSNN